jgi:hypothetical protein
MKIDPDLWYKYPELGLLEHTAVLCLNFLMYRYTVFHGGCTIFYSYQQNTGLQFLHMLTNTFVLLFDITILTGVR